jgi:hypothetical protein
MNHTKTFIYIRLILRLGEILDLNFKVDPEASTDLETNRI